MRRSRPPESATSEAPSAPSVATAKAKVGGADERTARKALARIDRQLERLLAQEAALNGEIAAAASDHEAMATLTEQLGVVLAEKDVLEAEWLEVAAILE